MSLRFGTSLPAGAGLHLAAPLAFAGLLARSVPDGHTLVAAVVAAGVVAAAASTAGPLTLPIAVGLGVAVALRIGRAP